MTTTRNLQIAAMLQEAADSLQQQGANPFQINAVRRGAQNAEEQCTVVTETRGPLEGLRAVQGGEAESREIFRRLHHGCAKP